MRISMASSLLLGATVTIATDSSACTFGHLGQLLALLKDYAPAISYCSGLIPSHMPMNTTTITQCQPEATQQAKRDDSTTGLDDYELRPI